MKAFRQDVSKVKIREENTWLRYYTSHTKTSCHKIKANQMDFIKTKCKQKCKSHGIVEYATIDPLHLLTRSKTLHIMKESGGHIIILLSGLFEVVLQISCMISSEGQLKWVYRTNARLLFYHVCFSETRIKTDTRVFPDNPMPTSRRRSLA